MKPSLLALLLLPAATLPAAELVTRDLIAEASVLPNAYTYTLNAGGTRLSGQDAFADALGVAVGGRLSLTRPGDPVGLVVGLDLDARRLSCNDSELDVLAPRGALGVGWALSDRWELYGEFLGGWGLARHRIAASNAAPEVSASGSALIMCGRIVGLYRLTRDLAITAHLGWERMDTTTSDGNVDMQLAFSDPVIGIGVAWRLSSRPVLLE